MSFFVLSRFCNHLVRPKPIFTVQILPKPYIRSFSSTMSAYKNERLIAELAVQRASLLTDKVFHSLVKGTVTKDDKSPVTSTRFYFFYPGFR